MNILITGAIGFIGFNLANSLLKKSKKNSVIGIDNFDEYYSIKLKKKRLNELKKNQNFKFKKIDITNKKKLSNFLKKNKVDLIIHLAAQAGVRYSFDNPKKYIEANFFGFLNIATLAAKFNIKKVIYASSSSVYGDSKKLPVNEKDKLNTKNIYAETKKLNEKTADLYSKISNTKFIGLRFFTIFGEWGRPDMLIFKIFNAHIKKKILNVNNFGNHYRDFTYIGDVIEIFKKLIPLKISSHIIFNICSNNPIKIEELIENFKSKYSLKTKHMNLHKADVLNTHGDNSKLKKILKNFRFSPFYPSIYKTFDWYKKNKIYKF